MSTLLPNTLSAAGESGSPAADQMLLAIRRIVHQNTRRWRILTLLEGIGLAIAAPLGLLFLAFLLDNVLHLSMFIRIVALVGFLVVAVYLGWRLVHRWRLLRLTEDQVALAIESRTAGGLQNRLINALQIARGSLGPASDVPTYTRAIIEENYQQLQAMEMQQAAHARPAMIRLALAGIVLALGAGFWLAMPRHFSNAAQRILLPLAHVEPLYRTRLTITPGQLTELGDYPITIAIEGKRPTTLQIIQQRSQSRTTQDIPVPAGDGPVSHTLRDIRTTTSFAVRGGDYTSPFFQVIVPSPALLTQLRATYEFPGYTRLPDRQVTSVTGELEALQGTMARIAFTFDQPTAQARLVIHRPGENAQRQAINLTATSDPATFTGQITFDNVLGYELLTRREEDKDFHLAPLRRLTVLPDQEPALQLINLSAQLEAEIDQPLALQIEARDDLGLLRVGVFHRLLPEADSQSQETTTQPAWAASQEWPLDHVAQFSQSYALPLDALGGAEGDRIQLVLQGRDSAPDRAQGWSQSPIHLITLGGPGASLQLIYESIWRDENSLRQTLASQQKLRTQSLQWLLKLDPSSGFKLDDNTRPELAKAMTALAQSQTQLRDQASQLARRMNAHTSSLRLSIAMLADTEMIRIIRMIQRASQVNTGMTADDLRDILQGARLGQDRVIKSLEEILTRHVQLRQEWEDNHMAAFVAMLSTRQESLQKRTQELAAAGSAAAGVQATASRRQEKLAQLVALAQTATAGVGQRITPIEAQLGEAFTQASAMLSQSPLKEAMTQAANHAKTGRFAQAAPYQKQAAERLAAVHQHLEEARKKASRHVVQDMPLTDQEQSDLAAQAQVDELRKNPGEVQVNAPEGMSITQIIQQREKVNQVGQAESGSSIEEYLLSKEAEAGLQRKDDGRRQDPDILELATVAADGEKRFPNQSDRQGNTLTEAHVQAEFEDLVGDLLEGIETLREDYDTLNLNAAFTINEPGEISQQAGDLNSTAAAAATGNQQPPPADVGGISRSGRKGARSHGTAVGDESFNRRGKDVAQEAAERVADVAGKMREVETGDPQIDMSTGVGGKVIDTKESHFSIKDKGKWTDDIADRMQKPLEKNQIVERQDGTRMDPKIAAMLYELEGSQEQVVERLKTIRKKLDNLYLPTDQIDELMAQLDANLQALREKPDPELFRQQLQTLSQLAGTVRVMGQAMSGFEPSLPRDPVIRGNVIDDPASQPLPGYEEAVKNYYLMLSSPNP